MNTALATIMLIVALAAAQQARDETRHRHRIAAEVAKLSEAPVKLDQDSKILLAALLLHSGKYGRLIDMVDGGELGTENYYVAMAYAQALIAVERYGDAARCYYKAGKGRTAHTLEARGSYYQALEFWGNRDYAAIVESRLARAVRWDPAFELPYSRLCELVEQDQAAVAWAAKGLCVMQPDKALARKTLRQIVERLKLK